MNPPRDEKQPDRQTIVRSEYYCQHLRSAGGDGKGNQDGGNADHRTGDQEHEEAQAPVQIGAGSC